MKMKFFFMLATCMMLLTCRGANLLKNSDFSDLTGAKLPRYWTFRGPLLPNAVNNGKLTLGGNAEKKVFAVQYHLPIKPGVQYTMSWVAAGKAPYFCYVEYSFMADGKKHLKSIHSNKMIPVAGGSKNSFQFSVPAYAEHTYVAFCVQSADTVTFSQLQLKSNTEEKTSNLLKNSDFSRLNAKKQPVDWICRGAAENFRFAENKVDIKGKKTFFVASMTQGIGKELNFSCNVKGKGKFKIYVEWYWVENGKKCAKAAYARVTPATTEVKKVNFKFNIPQDKAKTAVLAILVDSDDFVTFSDLKVQENVESNFTLSGKSVKTIKLGRLLKNQQYKISYMVKGSGATGGSTTFHFYKTLLVDRSGSQLLSFPADDCLEKFQNKSAVFTAPADKDIYLKITSQTAGTLEFKNLTVKPYSDASGDERLVITSPRFRNNFYSSIKENSVAGFVISKNPLAGGEALLKTSSGKTYTAKLQQQGNKWTFSFPGTPGDLLITLNSANGEKKQLKEKIRQMPPAPVEVITGPGNRIYINGKPFFPIEISRQKVPMSEQTLHGGTSIRCAIPSTPEDCLKILNKCQKENLKVILSFMNTVPRVVNENALRLWQHRAENVLSKEVLAHPALMGYFLDDEPYWNGVPLQSLQRCYAVLKAIDPYRPVLICSAPRGTVEEQRAFASCCDIFGVDIYPVPSPSNHSHLEDKTISCVGKYTRRMKEITDGHRPVYMVLQACAWGDLQKNQKKRNIIYPTFTESRFMTFDAVINGTDSIVYWGLWYASSPEFYGELVQITRELHSLTGVLVSENSVPGKVSDPAVEYRTFYGKDWACTISANTQNKKVSVRFSDVPATGSNDVTYEPYEVKIFSSGKLPAPLSPLPPADPKKLVFQKALAAQRDAVDYTPPENMKWIWGEKEKSIPSSQIFARKSFTAASGLKKAFLRVAADDFIENVIINGKQLDCNNELINDYKFLNNIDITGFLQSGSNQVCIQAADGAPLPCGLLAEIRLEYADGKIVSIPTDSSWETAPELSSAWQKAAVIKNLGDKPWGMPRLMKVVTPIMKK